MSIEDIKRALVEVSKICDHHQCNDCPFGKKDGCRCRLHYPLSWAIDDWDEDGKDENA